MTTQLSDRDAFYEKMYFHEIKERDRLDDGVRTLLTIVAIVFAIIAFLFNAVIVESFKAPVLFWLVYVIAVTSFIAAVTCYIKAWHSQYYSAFPLSKEIEQYVDQIRDYYQSQTDERTAMQWTEQAFSEYMRQSFIEHASLNAHANGNRQFWLYYGNSFVISSFAFSVMAFFPISDKFVAL